MSGQEYKQAVIYCRVSDPKQVKMGNGLESQETRCREFASMRRFDIVGVFKDDITGETGNRPGMKAMLAFVRKYRATGMIVIIDDISRLARDIHTHTDLRSVIAKAGGILKSPSIEFGDDADSRLHENLMASVSQHQRQKNAEQTKNRMRARVQNGYWVFQAPIGYRYQRVTNRGMMLTRDEPVASVVQEALEGYASGRFETQADVMRFLQESPLYPKDSRGIVRHQRVGCMLSQVGYAGYIEAPDWDVSLRPAQHEGLISFDAYHRIQERLRGIGRLPKRRNLNADFPLRGHVLCADCTTPLTACWSTGAHARHPYYLCPKKGCASYGKSIRRDKIEGEFQELLLSLRPSDKLFTIARSMFRELWARQASLAQAQKKAMALELAKVDGQVKLLLERILDVSVPSVIAAYEQRVQRLEEERFALLEKIASGGRPASDFDTTLRTALDFLANPWNLWRSERLEDRRAVLKLAFARPLHYVRNEGFRTADLSLPFKVLGGVLGGENKMARPGGFEPPA